MATYNGFKSIEGKEFYERSLLHALKENNILLQFAKKTTLPKNHGDTITWRKRKPIPVQVDTNGNVRTLVEGITPSSNKLEFVEFQAKIKEYGDWIKLTKKLTNLAIDPVLSEASDGLGESAGETFDQAIMEVLLKNPNSYNAGGSTFSSSTYLSLADLHKIKANFERRNVKPYFSDGYYALIISPEVEYDLKSATGTNSAWIDLAKYSEAERKNIMKGEIGRIFGFKVIVYNKIKSKTFYTYNPATVTVGTTTVTGKFVLVNGVYTEISTTTTDPTYTTYTDSGKAKTGVNYYDQTTGTGHVCLALGKDAFGTVDLEGESAARPTVFYNAPGTVGTDPLKQRHSLAWKNEGWCCRVIYPEALVLVNAASSLTAASDFDDATGYFYTNGIAGTKGKYQSYDVQDSGASPSTEITD